MFDLANRHLYLCAPHREDMSDFLPAVLRGGVDVVQLREKELPDAVRVRTGRLMAQICADFEVPFIMNDSPHLALEVGADGVHVGQEDASVAECRRLLGPGAIVGLSTHSPEEFDAALPQAATYFSAGPVIATPTKLGRAGTGVGYAVACQRRCERPVFVTGGVTATIVPALVGAGLRHFVVVRALCEAADPERAAREISDALALALAE